TLADRLEIMHAGRIVKSGTPASIAEGHPSTISFSHAAGAPEVPGDLAGVRQVVHEFGRTILETDALQTSMSDLLAWAARAKVQLEDLHTDSPSLESVFLAIADGREPAATDRSGSDTSNLNEGSPR
ncbi:MAG: hypothetical protein ABI384_02865, partial [Allobranchiibius sp.]